jgi:hypothetical protein
MKARFRNKIYCRQRVETKFLGNSRCVISTNNIATSMVRGGRKIRFRPPKIRFHPTLIAARK